VRELERELRIASRCGCERTRARTRIRFEMLLCADSSENLRRGVACRPACGLERELRIASRCCCGQTRMRTRARTRVRFEVLLRTDSNANRESRRGVVADPRSDSSGNCEARRGGAACELERERKSRRGVVACRPVCGLERKLEFVPRCYCGRPCGPTRARTETRVEVLLHADSCADSSENWSSFRGATAGDLERKFASRCCCVRTRARTRARTENRVEALLRADPCAASSGN